MMIGCRMFTSSLSEEVKALGEEIEAVKDKVDDPIMCAKIRQFVYAPREIQAMFKEDASESQTRSPSGCLFTKRLTLAQHLNR